MHTMRAYFGELSREFGAAWTRFWFTPRDSVVLCLVRILTGIVALYYIVSHSADLVRWFGPDGILNASTTQRLTGAEQLRYSFHYSYLYLAETPASLWILHGAGLLVVLAFTLGLWSRLTSIGALIVVLAYVHRAPLITGQLEPVLTMLLAYLCLAPTGRHFSLDAVWARHRLKKLGPLAWLWTDTQLSLGANISTRLIQLHLAGFCLMTGLNMLAADTWWAGEGVWWLIARTDSRLVDLTGLCACAARRKLLVACDRRLSVLVRLAGLAPARASDSAGVGRSRVGLTRPRHRPGRLVCDDARRQPGLH